VFKATKKPDFFIFLHTSSFSINQREGERERGGEREREEERERERRRERGRKEGKGAKKKKKEFKTACAI
jgi:hypothetical protein